jgi:hypothetical protein
VNALIGAVRIVPVNENASFTVWYSPAGFEGVVSTDAHLQDGDGDLLMVYANGRSKIISVQQVTRIVTDKIAQAAETYIEENLEYEAFWQDR